MTQPTGLPAPGAAPTAGRRARILAVILAAMFMAQFDLYVVNVAITSLQRQLHASPAALQLVVAGYGFTYASGLISGGRLGDIFGARRTFLAGTLAFAAASLLCGLAPSAAWLVAARLIQGLAGAVMVPQVLALITAIFPGAGRRRALAWFGVTVGVGAVAGQVLGGLLLDADVLGLGWRTIFLVNVPVGVTTAVLAARLLPAARPAAGPRLDAAGAAAIAASLALLLVPLVLGPGEGWPSWTAGCLGAFVPATAGTLAWERRLAARAGRPALDLALLRNPAFAAGLAVNVAVFAAFFSFMFGLSLLLQDGLGLSPLKAGLAFTPLGLAFSAASIASQRMVARRGAGMVTAGAAVAAAGLIALLADLSLSGGAISLSRLIAPMVVIGLGNGLAVPALTGAVLAGARPRDAGAAAGILTTSQQFASAAGVAALGTVFFAAVGTRHDTAAYAAALGWVSGAALVLLLVAAAASLLLPRPPATERPDRMRSAGGVSSWASSARARRRTRPAATARCRR